MGYKIKTFNTEIEALNLIGELETQINDVWGEPLYSSTLNKWGVILDGYFEMDIITVIGQTEWDNSTILENTNPNWFEIKI